MDHQTANELFSEYLDGELSGEQKRELEAHLEGCASCRQELQALRAMLGSLAGLPPIQPPKEFARKVQTTIRRRSRGRFFTAESLLRRVPFEWISFVIILLMLVMYFMMVQVKSGSVKPAPKKDGGAKHLRRAPASQPASQPASRPTPRP